MRVLLIALLAAISYAQTAALERRGAPEAALIDQKSVGASKSLTFQKLQDPKANGGNALSPHEIDKIFDDVAVSEKENESKDKHLEIDKMFDDAAVAEKKKKSKQNHLEALKSSKASLDALLVGSKSKPEKMNRKSEKDSTHSIASSNSLKKESKTAKSSPHAKDQVSQQPKEEKKEHQSSKTDSNQKDENSVSKSVAGGVKGEKETSKASDALPPKAKEPTAQQEKSAKAAPELGGVANEKETSAAKQADEPPAAEAKAAKAKARADAHPDANSKPVPGVEGEQKAGLFGFGKKDEDKDGKGGVSDKAACKEKPEWCKDAHNPPKDEYQKKGIWFENKGKTFEGDSGDDSSGSSSSGKKKKKKKGWFSGWGKKKGAEASAESAAANLPDGVKHNMLKDPPSNDGSRKIPVVENVPLPKDSVANLIKKKDDKANSKDDINEDPGSSFFEFVKNSPYPITTIGVGVGILLMFSCIYYSCCNQKEGDTYTTHLLDSADFSLP